jgi:hypothetical protein
MILPRFREKSENTENGLVCFRNTIVKNSEREIFASQIQMNRKPLDTAKKTSIKKAAIESKRKEVDIFYSIARKGLSI